MDQLDFIFKILEKTYEIQIIKYFFKNLTNNSTNSNNNLKINYFTTPYVPLINNKFTKLFQKSDFVKNIYKL